ncbi:fimbrial protein [Pantoea sp. Lu_F5_004]|uniref:fimbrial protein n=1 Tax=Pantoea sp. Lu_F5_004 TaxID=3443507 RepID=UPI003EC0C7C1
MSLIYLKSHRLINYYTIIMAMIISIIFSQNATASMGPCVPVGGVKVYQIDNIQTAITDVDKNTPGTILDKIFSFDLGGTYKNTGCEYDGPAYITATSDLPVVGDNVKGGQWFELNDYLAIGVSEYIAGEGGHFIPVPFVSRSNGVSPTSDNTIWKSGSKGNISLMIRKRFVGFSSFNKVVMYTQISTDPNTGNSGPYVSELIVSGQVDVPQSCELDAGKMVEMNFGNIGANLFVQAGAGNKPAGVNPQMHILRIKCKNMDANALLTLRLEANKVSGGAIVSDNADIGFIVADKDRKPLIPNDLTSNIPFQLDERSEASESITAWPVSITGSKPTEGVFTAEGYLRMDFQ